ncbi:hypothetical protein MNKW57_02410 [Biformimicrobium ophioploci]|uniref:Sulfotransferase n=1 Tax=Biformimicrobium ophioploci TaxID=3036711 RepID=A0ABQ6LV25_9GAMM|nr:hypothetical protein MNKW57_02410 [Microbulbifer sp. NKW57]
MLGIDPQRHDARIQRARCLVQAGNHAEAEQEADLCRGAVQDKPKLLDLLATVYSHIGKQEKAEPLARRASELAPADLAILSNAAAIQLFVGEDQRAAGNLTRTLQLAPQHYRSHWQLSKARRAADEHHCEQMETLLADPACADDGRVYLHYALGKEYEDLQQWQRAWEHYRDGTALQRNRIRYSADDGEALFECLKHTFDRQWFEETMEAGGSAQGRTQDSPIFILGLPRSGSTLVERIIGSHSQVQALGELPQWPLAVKRLARVRAPGLFRPDIVTGAAALAPQQFAERYRAEIGFLRDGSPFFSDKLPDNFLYLPLLAKAFPDARMVHVHRNPMDSCFAMFKQLFADAHPYSYSQQELADYYAGYRQLMDQWRSLLGDRLVEVDYDALVQQQETQTRQLLERLGLPFEEACLAFHRTPGAAATASAAQVRQPMHNRSVGRWRQFEAGLAPLRQALAARGLDV